MCLYRLNFAFSSVGVLFMSLSVLLSVEMERSLVLISVWWQSMDNILMWETTTVKNKKTNPMKEYIVKESVDYLRAGSMDHGLRLEKDFIATCVHYSVVEDFSWILLPQFFLINMWCICLKKCFLVTYRDNITTVTLLQKVIYFSHWKSLPDVRCYSLSRACSTGETCFHVFKETLKQMLKIFTWRYKRFHNNYTKV